MKYKIIPTLISKNQKELALIINHYKTNFKTLHLDVMDGKFVKNKSNWYNFKPNKNFKYEAHLMVNDPELWIKKNYNKFEIVMPDIEKIKKPMKLIEFVKSKNKKIGFALNPETNIKKIEPYLSYLDRVFILTVHPGKYGAEFLPETLDKIKEVRKIFNKDIEVDGHINPKTIKLCKKAGANIFAIGSYLKNSENLSKSIKELKKALK